MGKKPCWEGLFGRKGRSSGRNKHFTRIDSSPRFFAVSLLGRAGIPVLLTAQVDSVAKFWQHDDVIPENVAAAVNFYQRHGIIRGRPEITAANAAKTQILGNYRFDYRKDPIQCDALSWFDRYVTPSHAQSECDPHLWSQVEDLVRQRLRPEPGVVAANPQP